MFLVPSVLFLLNVHSVLDTCLLGNPIGHSVVPSGALPHVQSILSLTWSSPVPSHILNASDSRYNGIFPKMISCIFFDGICRLVI